MPAGSSCRPATGPHFRSVSAVFQRTLGRGVDHL
jgi:hypothetical protein